MLSIMDESKPLSYGVKLKSLLLSMFGEKSLKASRRATRAQCCDDPTLRSLRTPIDSLLCPPLIHCVSSFGKYISTEIITYL